MGATTQAEACRDLVSYLLSRVAGPVGRVLDVACGLGETTGQIKRHWPEADVTGVNFSAQQIAACREFQPDCRFQIMDAVHLEFPASTFDLVVCVEAPMHFRTRVAFLAEVLRVLKPGGWLAMSDMLFTSLEWLPVWHVPAENHIADMQSYGALLAGAGLAAIEVEDINERSWKGFCRTMRSWLSAPERANSEVEAIRQWKENLGPLEGAVAHYPVSWARKPATAR